MKCFIHAHGKEKIKKEEGHTYRTGYELSQLLLPVNL